MCADWSLAVALLLLICGGTLVGMLRFHDCLALFFRVLETFLARQTFCEDVLCLSNSLLIDIMLNVTSPYRLNMNVQLLASIGADIMRAPASCSAKRMRYIPNSRPSITTLWTSLHVTR